jgi:ABC-type branched-subunit amino acid transport system ATPase component
VTLSALGTGLRIEHLQVRFSGVVAVKDLSVSADIGRITGLIGPNGAGKSTTFNACSGLVTPTAGRIEFQGTDLAGLAPSKRAHLGIGRTFQRMELFDSLSVGENVALGREGPMAGKGVLSHLVSRRGEKELVARAAEDAMEQCGLNEIAGQRAGLLSTGQRRLVELARALAGGFSILLLDEPSSGLDAHESHEFAVLLRRVVDASGVGILLVEHDMSVIGESCDYVYVMDFGELIFEGTPPEILESPIVKAAYLGEDPLADLDGEEL